jgi:competence ComEA-like helix-hairpin-helix protein
VALPPEEVEIEEPVAVEKMPPEEPVALPPEEVEIEEPVAVEKPIPVPPPAPAAPPAPRPPRRKAKPALPPEYVDESSYQEIETFGAVNLNAANVEQMMTLEGMTPGIAESIVSYRKEHGPFKSIFDLQDVPRLGRKTFRKITGMPYSKARHHRSWKLAKLLEMPVSKVTHLPTMAEAIARMPGFSGCVMSDCDGMLLAQSGAGTYAQAMSAIAPKILMQAGGNMDLLNVGSIESISISIKDRMFTLVACQKVCLTAIHAKEKLGKGQLVLIRKIAKELAWLLSHRAYVGR